MSYSENNIEKPLAIARINSEMKAFVKANKGGEPNTIVEKEGITTLYDSKGNPFVRTDVAENERTFQGVDSDGKYYDFSALYIKGSSEISYAGQIYDKADNSLKSVVGDEKFDPVECVFDAIKNDIESAQSADGKAMGDE